MKDSELEELLRNTFTTFYQNCARDRAVQNHNYNWNDVDFFYSGINIVNRYAQKANVIDVGCGQNFFKEYFKNLIGIDLIGPDADYITSLKDFKTDTKFDVAICFGSMQFGDKTYIRKQISNLEKLMMNESDIIWKFSPDSESSTAELKSNRLPLSEDILNSYAKEFGYTQHHFMHYPNQQGKLRGYCTWTRG